MVHKRPVPHTKVTIVICGFIEVGETETVGELMAECADTVNLGSVGSVQLVEDGELAHLYAVAVDGPRTGGREIPLAGPHGLGNP